MPLSTHQVFSALRLSFPPMHTHRQAPLPRQVSLEPWPFSTLLWPLHTSPFPDRSGRGLCVLEPSLDPFLLSFEIVRAPGRFAARNPMQLPCPNLYRARADRDPTLVSHGS